MNKRPYISPFCCVRPIRVEGMICVSMKVNSYREMKMEEYDLWGPDQTGIWNNTGSTDDSGEGNGDYGYGTEGF